MDTVKEIEAKLETAESEVQELKQELSEAETQEQAASKQPGAAQTTQPSTESTSLAPQQSTDTELARLEHELAGSPHNEQLIQRINARKAALSQEK